MVRAIDRKLLRDLRHLRGQVITIALVVACGIASYVTLQSTWASLQRSMSEYYLEYRFGDVFVHLERAPEGVRHRLEEIAGVALAYTRVVEGVTLPLGGQAQPPLGQPGVTASLTIRYLAPTPLHRELVFEAALTRTEGRKIFAKGHCRAGDTITAEAEAQEKLVKDIKAAETAEIAAGHRAKERVALAGGEACGDRHLVAAQLPGAHLNELYAAVGHDPDRRLAVAVEHRAHRQARCDRAVAANHELGGHADRELRILVHEGDPRRVSASRRVGDGRELAQPPGIGAAGRGPQPQLVAHAVGELVQAVLGHADRDFQLFRARQPRDGLPGSEHLSCLGFECGDHASVGCRQRGIAYLVGGLHRGGPRGGDLLARLARPGGVPVELRLADEVARAQLVEAFQVGLGEGGGRLGLRKQSARLRFGEPCVARVDARDHLAGGDTAADLDCALQHVAGKAERQPGLVARAYFA